MLKKIISLILCGVCTICFALPLSGCDNGDSSSKTVQEKGNEAEVSANASMVYSSAISALAETLATNPEFPDGVYKSGDGSDFIAQINRSLVGIDLSKASYTVTVSNHSVVKCEYTENGETGVCPAS